MYVLAYTDFPDVIVFRFDEMKTKISEMGCIAAYEYKMEDKWIVQKKYEYVDCELAWSTAGDWNTSLQYYYYNDPNKCSSCKSTRFMQGTYCLDCNSCTECNQIEMYCTCLKTNAH